MKRAAFHFALAAVLAITVAVHWVGLRGPFLLDDFEAIHPLVAIDAAGGDWKAALSEAPHHVRQRWVSNASFLATQAIAPGASPNAFAFKLTNLLLHLANGVLVALLALRLAARWQAVPEVSRRVAWFAAGLFLLHPLLVSTTLYPVQRMAQLSTCFALSAVLAYHAWRSTLHAASTARHAAGIATVVACTLLAFYSKENGALVPLLLVVLELTAFQAPAKGSPERARFETGFGVLAAGPIVLGAVYLAVRWDLVTGGYLIRDFTLSERLLTQLHVVGGYVADIAWPRIGRMGLYHDDVPVQSTLDLATAALFAAFAVALVAGLALRRRFPALAFGVLWFLAAHAMESTFLPLEMVFEHRNYLALVGPAVAVAWLVASTHRRILFVLGTLLLCGLAVQTARRAWEWRDYASWMTAEAAHHTRSLRAATDLFSHQLRSGDIAAANAMREAIATTLPNSAQARLLKLGFACQGPIAVRVFDDEDIAFVRQADVGKDAFHAFVGLREHIGRTCEHPDWVSFAVASEAVAANPAVEADARAAPGWWRLAAGIHRLLRNWPAVDMAVRRTLERDARDPRDWLTLAEASAYLGNRGAYLDSRQRALALLGPDAPRYADIFGELDALSAQAAAAAEEAAARARTSK